MTVGTIVGAVSVYTKTVIVSYGVLLILSLAFWVTSATSSVYGLGFKWGIVLVTATAAHIALSIRSMDPKEQGVILFFGRVVQSVEKGPVFVPFLLCELRTVTKNTVQQELPAEPERIYREKDAQGNPKQITPELIEQGFRPPIRVTFANSNPERAADPLNTLHPDKFLEVQTNDSDDPLNKRLTTEVTPVVSWRVMDFNKFLTTMGTVDEAKTQLADIVSTEVFALLAIGTPARTQINITIINDELRKRVAERTQDLWGIEILKVQLKPLGFSWDVNTALQKVTNAITEASAKKTAAEAEKVRLQREGEGKAAATKAENRALEDRAKKMKANPEMVSVLAADVATGFSQNAGTIIVPSGGSGVEGLVAMATTITDALKSKNGGGHANA